MKNLSTVMLFIISSFCYSQAAKEYYKEGASKYKLEDYRGAIQDFTNAIELAPKDVNAYMYRGFRRRFL